MSSKIYAYLFVVIAIIGIAVYTYSLYSENKRLKVEKALVEQNIAAFKDSLKAKADSIIVLTAFIRDIAFENNSLKNGNLAFRSQIKVLIDSIRILGDAYAEITDSTIKVYFEDKQFIASCKGHTTYRLFEKKSSYELNITFDPVRVGSELFEEDGIWKVRTSSLTPGIKVSGISEIDTDTYNRLQKYKPSESPRIFGANMMVNSDKVYLGITVRTYNNWYVNFDYRINQRDPSWFNNTLIGVHYFIF